MHVYVQLYLLAIVLSKVSLKRRVELHNNTKNKTKHAKITRIKVPRTSTIHCKADQGHMGFIAFALRLCEQWSRRGVAFLVLHVWEI